MANELVSIEPIAVKKETAAKLADCSYSKISQLVRDGKLPTTMIGKDQRVLVDGLRQFLANGGDRE